MAELVTSGVAQRAERILQELGVPGTAQGVCTGPGAWRGAGAGLTVRSPIDGTELGRVTQADAADFEAVVQAAHKAFEEWRMHPAPKRGEVVRQMGDRLRRNKEALGALVTIEMGKILEEGKGEVQEMIDIADFAVGLSRQLYGKTMHSERARHRMYEQWHPIGPVGVISAFNFPVAVWAWNAFVALVCGDPVIWKPSRAVPLSAIAVTNVCNEVLEENGWTGLTNLAIGPDEVVGEGMTGDRRIPVVSATGSCRMGKIVGPKVQARMGRSILELGGNNAILVSDKADLDLAVPAIVFGAAGTAGQRCTSTRRVYVHRAVFAELAKRLVDAYRQLRIGNPLESGTLVGPLINGDAVQQVLAAIKTLQADGGKILVGGKARPDIGPNYMEPTIAHVKHDLPLLREETFGPLVYLVEYDDLAKAIRWHNDVPQGLSSSIFTLDMREAETFLSHMGSDCGIANVNIGTSGAEIGGAFGGEKETGGGREAGSDSWKQYMRRQTNTINWSRELPLAQGIRFGSE